MRLPMATIEGRFCRDDTDCSEKQYCYDVSNQCVDYTQCSRYNRQENGKRRSQSPSQCGPCLPGYDAETLSTGKVARLCKKSIAQQNFPEADKLNYNVFYVVVFGVLVVFILAVAIFIFFKRRMSRRQGSKPIQCKELSMVEATAPPLENSPFIKCGERSSPEPFNNNKNFKDKNHLVCTVPCTPPNWVRTNPNYENNLTNDNINVVEPLSVEDQPNDWSPEHLTIEVANRNIVAYEIEQVDNSLNTMLVQTNNPSSSNATQEDNNNNNNNNNNSNSGSTSESNNTRSSRERVQPPNIMISQKISMNVNVLNGD